MKHLFQLLIIALSIALFDSCEKQDRISPSSVSAKILAIETTETEALVSGSVCVSGSQGRILGVILFYGKAPDCLEKKAVTLHVFQDEFFINLTSLEEGSCYYCRVVVIVNNVPLKGEVMKFETNRPSSIND